MESSAISNRQTVGNTAPAPSTRNRAEQDYARQAAAEDAARQEHRATNNRTATRRRTQSAFEQSIEQDRALQRYNEQAGVEKMVRSVARKEAAQAEESRSIGARDSQEGAQPGDPQAKADFVREKLNATYATTSSESIRDQSLRPSPSQRQQQRAIESYQQSNQNSIDRALELVV